MRIPTHFKLNGATNKIVCTLFGTSLEPRTILSSYAHPYYREEVWKLFNGSWNSPTLLRALARNLIALMLDFILDARGKQCSSFNSGPIITVVRVDEMSRRSCERSFTFKELDYFREIAPERSVLQARRVTRSASSATRPSKAAALR